MPQRVCLIATQFDVCVGFKLNGELLHIRGFSHHSDFGAVGGAVPDRVNLFRANALRSVGGNTWRTSHNPYRPALYDIMDATGILVWDENRDFNQMAVKDMETLVRRDRNHPSVIIWSACNEVECYVDGNANMTGVEMMKATKKWDTTRPFSANQNHVRCPIVSAGLNMSNGVVVARGCGLPPRVVVAANARPARVWFGDRNVLDGRCLACPLMVPSCLACSWSRSPPNHRPSRRAIGPPST